MKQRKFSLFLTFILLFSLVLGFVPIPEVPVAEATLFSTVDVFRITHPYPPVQNVWVEVKSAGQLWNNLTNSLYTDVNGRATISFQTMDFFDIRCSKAGYVTQVFYSVYLVDGGDLNVFLFEAPPTPPTPPESLPEAPPIPTYVSPLPEPLVCINILETSFLTSKIAIERVKSLKLGNAISLSYDSIYATDSITEYENLIAVANSLGLWTIIAVYNAGWEYLPENAPAHASDRFLFVQPENFTTWKEKYPFLLGVHFGEIFGHQIDHHCFEANASGLIFTQQQAEDAIVENITASFKLTEFKEAGAVIFLQDSMFGYVVPMIAAQFEGVYIAKLFNAPNTEIMLGTARGMTASFNSSVWGVTVDLWGKNMSYYPPGPLYGREHFEMPYFTVEQAEHALYESWLYGSQMFQIEQGTFMASWADKPGSGNLMTFNDGTIAEYGLVMQKFYRFILDAGGQNDQIPGSDVAVLLGQDGYAGRGQAWGLNFWGGVNQPTCLGVNDYGLWNLLYPNVTAGRVLNSYGVNNLALYFNGVNEYIDCGTRDWTDELGLNDSITLLIWYKPASVTGYHAIFDNYFYERWGLFQKDNEIDFMGKFGGVWHEYCTNSDPLTLNEWSRIVLTYNATDLCIYSDGALQNSWAETGMLGGGSNPLYIGIAVGSFEMPLNGTVDEIIGFNRTFSPLEVIYDWNDGNGRYDYYSCTGRFLHLRLESRTTMTALDDSGEGNDGSVYGANIIGSYSEGADSALSFNGANNYVSCESQDWVANYGLEDSLTLMAWINATTISGSHAIVDNYHWLRFGFYQKDNNLELLGEFGGVWKWFTTTTGAVTAGNYQLAGFTKNATHVSIYLNGTLQDCWAETGDLGSGVDLLCIGVHAYAYEMWFNGGIDDVLGFGRALPTSEMAWYYNSGNGRTTIYDNDGLFLCLRFNGISSLTEDESDEDNVCVVHGSLVVEGKIPVKVYGSNWWSCIADPLTVTFTGTPFGLVDIVSQYAPLPVLEKYKAIFMTGWFLMNDTFAGKLGDYVANGGVIIATPRITFSNATVPYGDCEDPTGYPTDYMEIFGIKIDTESQTIVNHDKFHDSINYTQDTFWNDDLAGLNYTVLDAVGNPPWTWQFRVYTNMTDDTRIIASYDGQVFTGPGIIQTYNATLIQHARGGGYFYFINVRHFGDSMLGKYYGDFTFDFFNMLLSNLTSPIKNQTFPNDRCWLQYETVDQWAWVGHDDSLVNDVIQVNMTGFTANHTFRILNITAGTSFNVVSNTTGIISFNVTLYGLYDFSLYYVAIPENLGLTILNMEGCGNWVFSMERFYRFNASVYNFEGIDHLDLVEIGFSDGWNWVNCTYDVALNSFNVSSIDGDLFVGLRGTATEVSDTVLFVYFDVWFNNEILDSMDVDLYMRSTDAYDSSAGWETLQSDYFNIYNLGGFTEIATVGNATRGAETIWDWKVGGTAGESQVNVNQTWRNLKSARWVTGLYDYGGISCMVYTEYGLMFCDQLGVWTTGINVRLNITDWWFWSGWLVGTNKIEFTVDWYNGNTWLKRDLIYGYFEHVGDYNNSQYVVDLWVSSDNQSTIWGGHVNVVYQDETGIWGTGPANVRYVSQCQDTIINSQGNRTSANSIKLWKTYFEMKKVATQEQYRYGLTQNTQHNLLVNQPMKGGVDHPTFLEPKPYVGGGSWGFFEPIRQAVMGIAGQFINALIAGIDTVFTWIGWRNGFSVIIGWFSQLLGWFPKAMVWMFTLFTNIFQVLIVSLPYFIIVLVNIVSASLSIFTTLISLFSTVYGYLLMMWGFVEPFWNIAAELLPFSVGLFVVYLLYLAATGRGDEAWGWIKMIYGFINFMAGLTMGLVNLFRGVADIAINIVMGLLDVF